MESNNELNNELNNESNNESNQNTTFNLVIPEDEIQKMWESNNIFEKSINKITDSTFVFYDGPPFATGLPHYGHILAGFIKDTIGRFQTMKGYTVPRKAGWDCHGLPIEYEIEKAYSISNRQQIEEWGISNYNKACKDIVLKYSSEWEKIMNRLGRWVDFKNDYKTMDFDFMNSVWWVFSELANKNLIYPSYKVMPYSVACKTPLSNFETQQNYQEIEDITAYVKFTLKKESSIKFGYEIINLLVWTTTPWTLPSNLVIAIGPTIKYSIVKTSKTDNIFIIASALINKVFSQAKIKYDVLFEINADDLIGLEYEPLFNSYQLDTLNDLSKAFKIIVADFITELDGTGIVHIAPSYGEDDYNACTGYGVISKTDELFMSIDEQGYFQNNINSLEDLGGIFYKFPLTKSSKLVNIDINSQIILKLTNLDKIFYLNKYKHNYPFCWRSDTPLMYRAVKSWFINVEKIKDRMVELNQTINWIPENIGSGRFHNWLNSAKDWCIARNRYWGTPIPIWVNQNDQLDYIVVKSAQELEQLCKLENGSINDLHMDNIDHLIFYKNGSTYKRISMVFDCWFESGSMPYASIGYPYKTDKITFPADFIAEGIDQTRGWFYTLLVISVALFDSVPFYNVIVNGLILASDGKKMSKRLKNYPDPMTVISKYGSDALRLYLLSSPATKADILKFNEAGVHSMVRDIIIPLKNSLNFFLEYKQKYNLENQNQNQKQIGINFQIENLLNPLDIYAIKYINNKILSIKLNLDKYLLADAIRDIYTSIEMLNNQYIKYNRYNLKGKNILIDQLSWYNSLNVLYLILQNLVIAIAPLTPYLSEYIYQNMFIDKCQSIHLLNITDFNNLNLNIGLEQNLLADEMIHVLNVINLVSTIRSKNNIIMTIPLEKLIIRTSIEVQLIILKYSNIILDELNVLELESLIFEWSDVKIESKPNFNKIKEYYPTKIEKLIKLITTISEQDLKQLAQGNNIEIESKSENNIIYIINPNMVQLIIKPINIIDTDIKSNYISDYIYTNNQNYSIYLNLAISDKIKILSYGRLIATRLQKMKKEANLHSWDKVILVYDTINDTINNTISSEYISIENKLITNQIEKICNAKIIKLNTININHILIYHSMLYLKESENYNSINNINLFLFK